MQNATVAAMVGGNTSVIGGGKFQNGAMSGAFSRMFNDLYVLESAASGGKLFGGTAAEILAWNDEGDFVFLNKFGFGKVAGFGAGMQLTYLSVEGTNDLSMLEGLGFDLELSVPGKFTMGFTITKGIAEPFVGADFSRGTAFMGSAFMTYTVKTDLLKQYKPEADRRCGACAYLGGR